MHELNSNFQLDILENIIDILGLLISLCLFVVAPKLMAALNPTPPARAAQTPHVRRAEFDVHHRVKIRQKKIFLSQG